MNILKEELKKIKLSDKDYFEINQKSKAIIGSIKKELKKNKIKADVFLGGSFAKKTVMRKEKYDVDIFVRFDEKYGDDEISNLLEKCLSGERIHGSRDYFKIGDGNLTFEIVPVIKVRNPNKERNVTDLSFFHVSYVARALKNKRVADEIILAKAFCYANNCYGAESYIKGFSGYALELLIIKYKSFLGFLKAVAKEDKQIILDPAKHYKNKDEILLNLNEAKLNSPIVFVDPTNKNRNALAALSFETFARFREIARKFLKKPNNSFFAVKKINKNDFNLLIEAETDRQEGDIAGSKLLKYFNYLSSKIEKYFVIEKKQFEYTQKAEYYFKIKKKKELIFNGPKINDVFNVKKFKKKHKNCFVKKDRIYAKENISISIDDILNSDKKISREMGITGLFKNSALFS